MSGLTVGLLSIDISALETKFTFGTDIEVKQARRILPIVKKHHLLLVTLLIANSLAMEALPIMIERMVGNTASVIISVTLVLMFGEVIPQSLCTGPRQ